MNPPSRNSRRTPSPGASGGPHPAVGACGSAATSVSSTAPPWPTTRADPPSAQADTAAVQTERCAAATARSSASSHRRRRSSAKGSGQVHWACFGKDWLAVPVRELDRLVDGAPLARAVSTARGTRLVTTRAYGPPDHVAASSTPPWDSSDPRPRPGPFFVRLCRRTSSVRTGNDPRPRPPPPPRPTGHRVASRSWSLLTSPRTRPRPPGRGSSTSGSAAGEVTGNATPSPR